MSDSDTHNVFFRWLSGTLTGILVSIMVFQFMPSPPAPVVIALASGIITGFGGFVGVISAIDRDL